MRKKALELKRHKAHELVQQKKWIRASLCSIWAIKR